MSSYIVRHPTLRNSSVMVEIPPKTVRGRWKMLRIEVNSEGIGRIGKEAWDRELKVAQDAGLVRSPFLIIGEDHAPGATQGVLQEFRKDEDAAGVQDRPDGTRTINYRQFRVIMDEAKRSNTSRTRMADRPKGWT